MPPAVRRFNIVLLEAAKSLLRAVKFPPWVQACEVVILLAVQLLLVEDKLGLCLLHGWEHVRPACVGYKV